MGRKKKNRKWLKWRTALIFLLLVWFVFEGRFYLPKHIRPPKGIQPVEVMMQTTSYCHCRKCCSYHWFLFVPYQKIGFMKFRLKHVGETSSGAIVRPGTIAADTSIYPYGTVMYIPGYGYGRVEDTGGAIKGRHIDLYRPNHLFARKWGVRTKKVKVWLPANSQTWSFNPASETDLSTRLPSVPPHCDETRPVQESSTTNELLLPVEPVKTNESIPNLDAIATNGEPRLEDGSATNESPLQIPLP